MTLHIDVKVFHKLLFVRPRIAVIVIITETDSDAIDRIATQQTLGEF